jgi:integrase
MARRGNQEGAIYQRKDGRWVGVLHLGYANGKRQRKYYYGKTRREVQQRLTAALADHQKGITPAPERQTVAQFLGRYLETVTSGRAGNTQRNTRAIVYTHLIPAFGSRSLVGLAPSEIQGLYADLQRRGRKPSTVRQVHAILRTALKQAVAWGELVRNPCDLVSPPRVPQEAKAILDVPQARHLLAVAEDDPLHAWLWVALTTGLREGELLALHWTDLDLERGRLTVQRNLTRDGVKAPKSTSSRRTIPLVAPTVAALRRHGQEHPSAPLVFATADGEPLDVDWLRKCWWYPLLKGADLPRVHIHSLRHSAGSFLLALGMSLPQVSRILGHSSVAVTARVYAHVLEGGEQEILARLGELLLAPVAVNLAVKSPRRRKQMA